MDQKQREIVEFGDTLHRSGCPPYKVEKYTQLYAKQQGTEVMVQALPTSVNYQFISDNSKVVMRRMAPASINLALLSQTIERLHSPEKNKVEKPFFYPKWVMALANMSIPPAYLMLVGSTMEAIGCSVVLGFLVWLVQLMLTDRRSIAIEFVSALLVGVCMAWLSSTGLPIPVYALCIASVVLFVPGLSIANALECLAFNDLVSGTSLLGQSALVLLKLFIGIFMGIHIGENLWAASHSINYTNDVPVWLHVAGVPLISIAIGVIFNAKPRDMMLGLPVAILGMWGPLYLDFGSGWIVGTWVTTMLITFYGTWLAKIMKLTGSIYILQGIIILVPGSRVLVSASQTVFDQSILPIPSIGLSALFMFSAIVAGQVTAYSLYPPKNG
ncbi:threonine/serine exporter family protein [Vibrio ishigakensis]|uniref:threonine/serine ThrE exporter family protein n=1 Tax=Vibrio ishigakensis TaxID=1481914 RepID=UPI0021C4AB4A|nr:threonine/serine exporter family protein [Vibrio ishigakensis]